MSVDKSKGLESLDRQTALSATTPSRDLATVDRGRGVATDGGVSRFEDGPRECPYEEDYQHWVDDGELVVHSHPVAVGCDCGEEMTFDAFYGSHNETAGFTCGCGLDFVLAPGKCTPDHWECFADGGHETTFLLEYDGEYHFGRERETADDLTFRVRAPTMTDVDPEVATDGGTTTLPTIAFSDDHVKHILTGEKTVTVRYQFEYDLAPMERVQLVTADGDAFATARVTTQCELRADWIASGVFAGHRTYTTTQDLLDDLAEYYPDPEFRPGTVFDALAFQVEREIDQSADNDEWDFPSFEPLDRDDFEHVGDANDFAADEYDWVDACGHAYVRVEETEPEAMTDGGTPTTETDPAVTAEWLEGRYFCYPIACASCGTILAGAEENGALGRGDAVAIDADGRAICSEHTDEIHFVAAGTYAYGGGTPCETNRSFQPEDVVAVRATGDADQLATDGGQEMTEWECGNCGDSFETPGEPELPCLQCGADDWQEVDADE